MSLNQQYFTDAGITMLGHANAGQLLTITGIVVGDGSATDPDDIYPLTALINKKVDVAITRKKDLGGGKMIVSGILNEADLAAGPPFSLRELGVMAQIGTGGGTTTSVGDHLPSAPGGSGASQTPGLSKPISTPVIQPPSPAPFVAGGQLYCASNVFTDTPDTVTPGGTSQHAFDITIVIDRATNVTIVIGDATVVDCENIPAEDVGPGWYAQREGNVFQFKKAVAGASIDLDDESFPDRVIISVKTLAQNLDLYVPATYANPPPGTKPEQFFPDIQAAHDYLLQFVIPTDKFATIYVDAAPNLATGFVYNNSINFSHPNSKQISLIGRPRVTKNGTSISSVTPGLTKAINGLANTTDLVVGQRVYIAGAAAPWDGGCFVTAKTGTQATVSIEKRDTQANYTSPWNAACALSYYPTVLVHNNFTDPIFISCPYGIKLIQNLCIDSKQASPGTNGAYCISLESGSIQDVMVMRARRGITGGAGYVGLWGEIVVTQCDFGIISIGPLSGFEVGSPLLPFVAYINGCNAGIFPSASGFNIGTQIGNMDHTLVIISHCLWAIEATNGGTFRGGSIYFQWCDIGFWVSANSIATFNPAGYKSFPAGNGKDISAQGGSYVEYPKNGGSTPTCQPLADTFDYNNANNTGFNYQMAFIHVTA